jgi:hypothetical protein
MSQYTDNVELNVIVRISEDGVISAIPKDPANSDYQAYLNKDKAEQSTPMVTDEATTL